ncbi:nuclear receptor-interacting protein 2 [Corythoichthys intestinalis]|uniref:nuclear receptor-interacting protein 2 n=1 Tax=Corythoichthys intestinalis TaxID=161448 RepID=UPI0025A5CEA3|nr:nuclear receptor-interacting protein 2 [Corythoichthys intestinalis]XP_061809573.1 nuclear receptor-interacting protein 2-like [Nerophis lumbriciformis]
MSEAKKGELAIRDKAILHQQRRLKQATQFTHKDSADLLPLDGLKRLGTSKDLQPHSVVQRRLLEGNITRLRGQARDSAARVRSPLADDGGKDEKEDGADDSPDEGGRSDDGVETTALTALLVHCKCCDSEVKVSLNTSRVQNHISTSCCQRLGLSASGRDKSGLVSGLEIQLGSKSVQCAALIQEDETCELSLGLHTLLQLRCCLDLNRRVLTLGGAEELPFLPDEKSGGDKKA